MIGVPFDGMGRASGQAGAPEALRAAGLRAVFAPDAIMEPDLVLPGPLAQRAVGSGLLNERALLHMTDALHRRVRSSLAAGRFPFVYGADCSVLLAAVPALRQVRFSPNQRPAVQLAAPINSVALVCKNPQWRCPRARRESLSAAAR
jgi:arginase family enzyme